MSDFPSPTKPMRILAISGSLRRASTNTAAMEALARLAPEGVKVLLYRGLANLPPFNPDDDIEDKPKPEPVETLRAPRSTMRMTDVGSSARAIEELATAGKSRSIPLPSNPWQAEHWSR